MPSKKFDLEKDQAKKTLGRLAQSGTAARFGGASAPPVDRREQRRRDQAAGLVAFATKLPAGLVAALNAAAQSAGLAPGVWLTRELPALLPGYHAGTDTQEG
jgi:hypothetical protein